MSANTHVIDVLTRHSVYLQRYNSGIVNRMLPILEGIGEDIAERLISADLTAFQFNRLTIMQADNAQAIRAAMGEMNLALNDELFELAEYEAGFTNRMLDDMMTVTSNTVSGEILAGSLSGSKMNLISGKKTVSLTIDQAFTQFAGTTSKDVGNIIRSGITQGQTTREIGDSVLKSVKTRTRSQAESLIRTAANHSATQARSDVYKENSDILDGEIFIATLDSNTTQTCAGFDKMEFPVGEGPHPALHWNCRSLRVPKVKPEFTIVELTGQRASMNGPVSGQTNFSGWLRKQPKDFQDEYFSQFTNGKDRAKLFRNGGLSMSKFTDNKGIVYSLDELKRLEPQAFARASL